MEERILQRRDVSRTLDANPRASRQASMEVILQEYSEGKTCVPDILQGKWKNTSLWSTQLKPRGNNAVVQRIRFGDQYEIPDPLDSQILPGTQITDAQSVVAFSCNSSHSHAFIMLEHKHAGNPYNVKLDLQVNQGQHHKDKSGTVKSGKAKVETTSFGVLAGAADTMFPGEVNFVLWQIDNDRLPGANKFQITNGTAERMIERAQELQGQRDIDYNYYVWRVADGEMNCASFVENVAQSVARREGLDEADKETLEGISSKFFFGFRTPKKIAGL